MKRFKEHYWIIINSTVIHLFPALSLYNHPSIYPLIAWWHLLVAGMVNTAVLLVVWDPLWLRLKQWSEGTAVSREMASWDDTHLPSGTSSCCLSYESCLSGPQWKAEAAPCCNGATGWRLRVNGECDFDMQTLSFCTELMPDLKKTTNCDYFWLIAIWFVI